MLCGMGENILAGRLQRCMSARQMRHYGDGWPFSCRSAACSMVCPSDDMRLVEWHMRFKQFEAASRQALRSFNSTKQMSCSKLHHACGVASEIFATGKHVTRPSGVMCALGGWWMAAGKRCC